MKVLLVTHEHSNVDYFRLNAQCKNLIFVFKTFSDLGVVSESYDFLIIEQAAIKFDIELHYLKKMIPLDRVFLILDESKTSFLDDYISLGVRDVFVLPINLVELATKLRRAIDVKKSLLFANSKLGMSLKQILIFEVLKMRGPQGATRSHILEEIWEGEKVEPKNVDVHIHSLRKILKREGKEITWRQDRWFLTG